MVVIIYISRISGNKEIKSQQEKVKQILDVKHVEYEEIDISDVNLITDKEYMWKHGKVKDGQKNPLPPQIFNEKEYCGDFDDLDEANEGDTIESFLKLTTNGEANGDEN